MAIPVVRKLRRFISAVRMHIPAIHFHDLHIPEAEWRIGLAWTKLSEKHKLISKFSSDSYRRYQPSSDW